MLIYSQIRWFMDIHSAAGDILYAWGDDDDQTTTSTMNFQNSAYDGKRGVTGDTVYKEYIPPPTSPISRTWPQRPSQL